MIGENISDNLERSEEINSHMENFFKSGGAVNVVPQGATGELSKLLGASPKTDSPVCPEKQKKRILAQEKRLQASMNHLISYLAEHPNSTREQIALGTGMLRTSVGKRIVRLLTVGTLVVINESRVQRFSLADHEG